MARRRVCGEAQRLQEEAGKPGRERHDDECAHEQQREQDPPEQPQYVPVETVLSNASGGPVALNNDTALGRIAGGARATVNGKPLNY